MKGKNCGDFKKCTRCCPGYGMGMEKVDGILSFFQVQVIIEIGKECGGNHFFEIFIGDIPEFIIGGKR